MKEAYHITKLYQLHWSCSLVLEVRVTIYGATEGMMEEVVYHLAYSDDYPNI
jgi:hypothetical protein